MNSQSCRILWLMPVQFFPPTSGTQTEIFARLSWFLDRGATIHVICLLTENSINQKPIQDLYRHNNLAVDYLQIHSRWLTENAVATQFIEKKLKKFKPTLLFAEYPDLVQLLKPIPKEKVPKIYYRSHNLEVAHFCEKNIGVRSTSLFLRNAFSHALAFIGGLITRFKIERQACIISDQILHIGYKDNLVAKLIYPNSKKMIWLPPFYGRPRSTFAFDGNNTHRGSQNLSLIFAASNLKNNVNMDGADFIINKLAEPLFARYKEKVKIYIVGKNLDLLSEKKPENIVYVGFIENFDAFLHKMDAAIVPTRIGWGCKIKVVSAVNAGLPVLGHPNAFRGLPVAPFLLECRTVAEFLIKIESLLSQRTRKRFHRECSEFADIWADTSDKLLQKILLHRN